jgi:hypothetical protein
MCSQRVEPPSHRYGVPRDNAFHLGIREKDKSCTRITPVSANDFPFDLNFRVHSRSARRSLARRRVIRGRLVFVILIIRFGSALSYF